MDSYTLKSVSDLPAPFRSIFRFRYFNSLQSECFPVCFHSNVNMIISAPTGSGKTVLFELCILRLLSSFISGERFSHAKGTLKTIYIAPSKALVQEKLRDWNQKFEGWGISCLELTGDNEMYNTKNIQEADIILTTPEKFDAVTRCRMKDGGLSFFGDVALLLIDEVHLLNDPRGAALEAIVSRIKMIARIPEMKSSSLANIRLLAVSATIPNIEDLELKIYNRTAAAEWLMVPAQGVKRFGEEMRPVKLTTKVFGYTSAKNDFLFEKRLQNYIFDILMQYSKGKSALVFCSTRKGAQEAAQRLSQQVMTFGYSNPFIKSPEQLERLREASMSCSDKLMQSYILYGVGYHNGGLCMKDRNLVESLFLKGDIHVLCTTNTLAHGINLPAHTVVIKSTQHFNKEKGLYMEYDRSTILQMCGRAGRPPFDDTGIVIIMTRRETVHLYEDLLNGCEIVESQLLSCVTEHLTAEIVQMTIADITKAIEWMKCSYMYVRMKKNPEKYGVSKGIHNHRVEKHMQEICIQKINELSQHQLIWTDEDCFLLKPLEPGRLMSKYYLKFNTMKHIIQAPVNCSLDDTLHIICHSEELAWIQLRRNEKKVLNDINNDKDGRLRFHILGENGKRKKRIQTREEKIFVLTNDCLTGDPSIHDLALTQDVNSICSNGCRIAKCMKEYFVHKKNYRGALSSILLAKSLYQKLWEDSPFLLKQLPGIGMVTAKALQTMGVTSFETLSEADPRKIEIVTGRKYPFGNHIKESLFSLPPKVELKIEEIDCPMRGKSKLEISLTRLPQSVQPTKRHFADMIVGSEEENSILFHEKIRVDEFSSPYKATVLLSKPQQGKLTVKADLISEEYIGIDFYQKVVLWGSKSNIKNKVGKSKELNFPPSEEVFVLDDENKTSSQAPPKDLHNSANTIMENAFMPSFNLLDEDLADEIIAGEPVVSNKEDECMIITEQTVFDHIREKAKAFNVLSAPKNIFSLAPDTLNITRRFTHEKKPELPTEVEVLDSTARDRLQALTNSFSESNKGEQLKDNINNCQMEAVESWNTSVERDGDLIQTDEKSVIVMTEGTVFDHIRRKSRNFPMIGTLNPRDLESFIQTNKHSVITDSKSEGICKDRNCIRKTSAESKNKTNSVNARYGSPNPGLKTASTDIHPSSIDILSFDISMRKSNKRPNPVNSEYNTLNRPCSPAEPKRQSCSLETVSEIREVDPFVGFKSVFSFL